MARAGQAGSGGDTVALAACVLLSLLALVLPAPIRDGMAGSLRRSVTAPLLALQARAELGRTAIAERETLVRRLDSLALQLRALEQREGENARLRGLLSLARQVGWGFVPAEALGASAGDARQVVLTRGAGAGISPRAAVVSAAGLVGQVTAVDATTSVAILWSHPDFRASAMSADGQVFGIVRPHPGAEGSGELLELRGVPYRETVRPGARVVTSGLGGVYPRGVPIGVVLSELRTREVWSRTYLVRPAVFPADVTEVMVLLPQRSAAAGLDSAWREVGRADSAARRLAAVADSLERRVELEGAGQRARADSLARLLAPSPPVADSAPRPQGAAPPGRPSARDGSRIR